MVFTIGREMGGSREKNFPAHRGRSCRFLGHLTEAVANVQDTAFKQESRIGYFYQKIAHDETNFYLPGHCGPPNVY
jgi:hypothetical protein